SYIRCKVLCIVCINCSASLVSWPCSTMRAIRSRCCVTISSARAMCRIAWARWSRSVGGAAVCLLMTMSPARLMAPLSRRPPMLACVPAAAPLHGVLSRLERNSQINPQPARFELDPRLSAKAVADFAFDQIQAESLQRCLLDGRAAALDPVENEVLGAAVFDPPADFERSAGRG